MGTQVTFPYSVPAVGATNTLLEGLIGAVPEPLDILSDLLGVRVTSDVTTVGVNPVVRTLVANFAPSVAAVLALVLTNDGTIQSVTVGVNGLDYILPPQLTVVPNGTGADAILRAFLDLRGSTVDAGGAGYTAATQVRLLGGLPPADHDLTDNPTGSSCVNQIVVLDGGGGYPAGTTISVEGGNPTIQATATFTRNALDGSITSVTVTDMGAGYRALPKVVLTPPAGTVLTGAAKLGVGMAKGRPARVTPTIVANVITGLVITDNGDGYVGVPDVLITDAGGGVGAVITARMGVGRADIIVPGLGYTAASTVSVTPFFDAIFGTTAAEQAKPFFDLMKVAISRGALTPVNAGTPVVV